ncbi:PDR/VanB family oxidoreductase [Mameliella alba]|uniref:PDR/VanB family oxidoreductase n=1 Tax=Mameliella alba TaxID=561184 RepID=UPI001C980237|nr:PDR/VanB family oxidoreductase [Mameliella alba]MBY6118667.1 PDR/VanB family oxidoreductase [Mameliella alba]
MKGTLDVLVEAIDRETPEIISITLAPANGGALPPFDCGSHIDLHLSNGLIRQYSLWGSPEDGDRYRIAVKKEANSRGGSRHVHEALSVGDILPISYPRNNFPMTPGPERVVLLAGGVGITPILPMAEELERNDTDYELHYFTRSPELTAFADHIASSPIAGRTSHHFGLAPQEVQREMARILAPYRPGSHLYLCGPGPFIDMVVAEAGRNWPRDAVHLEYFSAAPPASTGGQEGFEVYLAKAGQSFDVPADMSIAEVLLENGIGIELSCEQGICGTCLTRVVDGIPDHQDMFLSEEEHAQNDQMTLCVSRCKGNRLVLDI